jgi:Zn-dependent protease
MEPTAVIFTIIILILSIIVHEVAHGYAALLFGDQTAKMQGRLTLNPLPHIDLMGSIIIPGLLVLTSAGILFGWAKPVPYNPDNLRPRRTGEAMVAAAGSLTNLAIAALFSVLLRGAGNLGLSDAFVSLIATIILINLFLGLFNLLPIPPFDGYTVLRSVLPFRLARPLEQFEMRIMSYGPIALVAVLFLFVMFLAQPFSFLVYSLFSWLVG